jgi:molecular chaperone GrpE (heat shock protein)
MQAELFAAQAELEMVEAELQKARAERQDLQDLAARRQADFDNYRKRVERERSETITASSRKWSSSCCR